MKKKIIYLSIVVLSTIFVLLLSTLIVTNSKEVYNYSVETLDLVEKTNLSMEEINNNYSYVVDYVLGDTEKNFKLPSLEYSQDGAIHFEEVRNLFTLAKKVIFLLIIAIPIIFLIYYKLYSNFKPIKTIGTTLVIIPCLSAIIVSLNFKFFFTIFHNIFFNNDKWLFDPLTDPIINILPEEFFALCGITILLITAIIGILLLSSFYILNRIKRNEITINN